MNHEWYSGEYLSVLGTVVIYLFQGLSIMKDFSDKDLYFGDYKGENFLVTFHGKRLKIGDFGCSMVTQEDTEADP
jgi:serine/threonine protein kinase